MINIYDLIYIYLNDDINDITNIYKISLCSRKLGRKIKIDDGSKLLMIIQNNMRWIESFDTPIQIYRDILFHHTITINNITYGYIYVEAYENDNDEIVSCTITGPCLHGLPIGKWKQSKSCPYNKNDIEWNFDISGRFIGKFIYGFNYDDMVFDITRKEYITRDAERKTTESIINYKIFYTEDKVYIRCRCKTHNCNIHIMPVLYRDEIEWHIKDNEKLLEKYYPGRFDVNMEEIISDGGIDKILIKYFHTALTV